MKKFKMEKIFVSKIVSVLLLPFVFFFKKRVTTGDNILVFEWYLLGDLVMISQCIKALKEGYPDKRLVLFCDEAWLPMADLLYGVDEVVGVKCPWSPKYRNYSISSLLQFYKRLKSKIPSSVFMSISFRGDIRDHILQGVIPSVMKLGLKYTGCEYMLTCARTSHESSQIKMNNAVLTAVGLAGGLPVLKKIRDDSLPLNLFNLSSEFIACNFFGGHLLKQYPFEMIKKFLILCLSKNINIHCFHTGDLDALESDCVHKLDLQTYLLVLSRAKLFIGVDSASGHIASAFGIPTILLFGPTDERMFSPISDKVEILKSDCPYMPCNNRCHFDRPYCMESITPERIVSHLIERLKNVETNKQ